MIGPEAMLTRHFPLIVLIVMLAGMVLSVMAADSPAPHRASACHLCGR